MKSSLVACLFGVALTACPARCGTEAVPIRQVAPPEVQLQMSGQAYLPSRNADLWARHGQCGTHLGVVIVDRGSGFTITADSATFAGRNLILQHIRLVDGTGFWLADGRRGTLRIGK